MTRTEERLIDALDAAARALREDTLRPLQVPERERRRLAWAAPVAAAASLLIVVGLGMAASGRLPWSGSAGGSPRAVTAPHSYYVEGDQYGHRPVVRSTATGAVTATVEVPYVPHALEPYLVAAAANGVFFAAVPEPKGERIYRFRLTGAGQVSGLSAVPGGPLASSQWAADAMAASPDGSRVAVALTFTGGSATCGAPGQPACPAPGADADYIDIVNTATGARSTWQGGMTGQGSSFSIINLSWTGNDHELVFLGQWCPEGADGSDYCMGTGTGGRTTAVWALYPASGGGRLDSGRLLLSQSASFPDIAQALVSPDGSMIIAVVLTGPLTSWQAAASSVTEKLVVEQISVATRKPLVVLYRRDMGRASEVNNGPDYFMLAADGVGQQWMLDGGLCSSGGGCSGGFNGWIDSGRLVPLQPSNGSVADEAW